MLCSLQDDHTVRHLYFGTQVFTFSLLNLHQIKNPMVVLKSAYHEDSETPPTYLI